MEPELVVLQTKENILGLIDYLTSFDIVAFDTETTGVHKGAEIVGMSFCCEENISFYIILQSWINGQLVKHEQLYETILRLLNVLKTKQLVMHNGLFECSMVQDNFKIRLIESLHTDTMVLAHLLDENRWVGLKDLAVTFFGEHADLEAREMQKSVTDNGGIWIKDNKEMYKCSPSILAKYGAKDALLTYRIFLVLLPQLFEQGLEKFFYEDESMPLLKGPTYELNTVGMKIDQQKLLELKKTLEAECIEMKAYIYQEIAPYIKEQYPGTNKSNTFNIGASQQLAWLLFGQCKLEFSTLTKGGKDACRDLGLKLPYSPGAKRQFIAECLAKTGTIQQPETKTLTKVIKAKKFKAPWAYIMCDKETLKKHAPKFKWIAKLLEYNKNKKMLSTYIEGIEERIQYGVIRPSFLQHGTKTGRYASRNPNFQNLPRDDKRIKSFVVSRPGKVFVGADQSQLEPRIFAYYSNDERLLRAFKGADDFYSVIGMEVYDKSDCTPRKEGAPEAFGIKYKQLRDISKTIALAGTYGTTAHQLAPKAKLSIEETQQALDDYFEKFERVKQYQLESHRKIKELGYVDNLFGRRRHIPDAIKVGKMYPKVPHSELPYAARNLLNMAVNFPIQSTGASIINRAAIAFYANKTKLGLNCNIVCQVHDSLIIECNEADADTVSLLLQDAMETTVDLKTIQFEAVPKVGKSLAEV